ncbi:MAG: hypothetical protein J4N94_00475 [Chloroflexi bacterium]|nr:hypothetical protein [Chloroflexota bacterium]
MAKFGALGVVSLGMFVGVAIGLTWMISAWLGRPVVFGYSEGPTQPIAFPHTTHVQELGLNCLFCHRNVTEGAAATIPSAGLCIACHKVMGDGLEEVEKLRDYVADNRPIDWVRVHRVPDHVRFVHEAHIRRFAGVKTVVEEWTDLKNPDVANEIRLGEALRINRDAAVGQTLEIAEAQVCSVCHGNVGGMTKVERVRSLKMGDCVDCHRDNAAPTDCTTCHF